jgi:hypothetical protein
VRIVLSVAALLALSCSTAFARSPRDPTLHRVAADVTLATTFLIAKRDLPAGFRDTGPDTSGSGTDELCKGVVQPDLHRLVMTADVSSHDFARTDNLTGFTQLSTESGIFRSAREAAQSMAWFARLPKATVQSCFEAAFRAGLPKTAKTAGFHLTVVHRTTADLHLDLWELQLRVQRNAAWIPVDLLIGSYRRGRALEMVLAVNVGPGLEPSLMKDVSRTISSRLLHASV